LCHRGDAMNAARQAQRSRFYQESGGWWQILGETLKIATVETLLRMQLGISGVAGHLGADMQANFRRFGAERESLTIQCNQ